MPSLPWKISALLIRQPYDKSWTGFRDATSYGPSCYGSGSYSEGLEFDEDCLSLNVVTPAREYRDGLPVFVWIHGGGLFAGGTADPRYNLSYIVQTSMEIGDPIIGVSINYRLDGFGFLSGGDVPAESTNSGLYDQRQALRWLNENIAAFGGDPDSVTIAGESAGGWSVGFHLVAFGGEHEGKLFRGAIMESGNVFTKFLSTDYYDSQYSRLLDISNCGGAIQTLDCLREIPAEELFDMFMDRFAEYSWRPVVDGVFFQRLPYLQMKDGDFAEVPIITGSTTDECTALNLRGRFNTTEQLRSFLINGSEIAPGNPAASPLLDPEDADLLLEIYPDDPELGCPFNTGSERFPHVGYQYKRGAAIMGDCSMQVWQRQIAQLCSSRDQDVYSYRFDQSPWDGIEEGVAESPPVGVSHFAEIPYIFANPDPTVRNWIGPDPSYQELSKLIRSTWVSFVTTQNPNNYPDRHRYPTWPSYGSNGRQIVFKVNNTYVEEDNYRQFQFFMDRQNEMLGPGDT